MESHPPVANPSPTETSSSSAPPSQSQQVADKVLSSSSSVKLGATSGLTRLLFGDPALRTAQGTSKQQEPIRVVLEESRS